MLVNSSTNKEAWIALRDKLRGEQNLVIVFGSELRGNDIAALVKFGSALPGTKFICLADYANSRGAQTWVYILICFRAITRSGEAANFIRSGETFGDCRP